MDFETARNIVESDVESVLREALAAEGAGHGFRIHEGYQWAVDNPVGNFNVDRVATAIGIPWQWTGIHRADLLGVSPLIGVDQEATVAGLTFVHEVEPDPVHAPEGITLHRFVDWLDTLNQLRARPRRVIDVRQRFSDEIPTNERLQRVLTDNGL